MKKDHWKWLERGISIAAILAMFMGWQRDRAVWGAKLDTLIKNDEKRTEYWNNQNQINGRVIEYMRLHGTGTGTNQGAEERP